jgi:hypothetical protein
MLADRSRLTLLLCALSGASAVSGPPTPKLRVCTGSVCVRYGAGLVLESAQGLACGSDAEVTAAKCLNACRSRDHTDVSTLAYP